MTRSSNFEMSSLPRSVGTKLREGRRPTGTVQVKALSARQRSKDGVQFESECVGTLQVGALTVKATDGHLLGLAAWVLNLGAVTVTVSAQPAHSWRVRSNAWMHDAVLDAMEGSRRAAVREEANFVCRFRTAFYTAHHASRYGEELLDFWTEKSLPKVLAIVPEPMWVNGRECLTTVSRRKFSRECKPAVEELRSTML